MNKILLKHDEYQEFPFVDAFDNYGDIEIKLDELKLKYGSKISGGELGCDEIYWGIYWIIGQEPTLDEVKEMMREACVDENMVEMYSHKLFPDWKDKKDLRHVKNCELGDNWKGCPACVNQHNQICVPDEVLPIPELLNLQSSNNVV